MNSIQTIKYIIADANVINSEIARAFWNVKEPEKIVYSGESELGKLLKNLQGTTGSKEVLILKEFRGRFFQTCPGTPGMICCNYRVINTCFNCLYDCAYCFLQMYLTHSESSSLPIWKLCWRKYPHLLRILRGV